MGTRSTNESNYQSSALVFDRDSSAVPSIPAYEYDCALLSDSKQIVFHISRIDSVI